MPRVEKSLFSMGQKSKGVVTKDAPTMHGKKEYAIGMGPKPRRVGSVKNQDSKPPYDAQT